MVKLFKLIIVLLERNTIDMESTIEKSVDKTKEKGNLTIWRVLAYFILYSVIGWGVETLFAFIMYGVIESRQSFMYGPFCAIYGVGAVAMIVLLRFFDKNNYILFIAGYIIGSIVEYIVSWVGEIWLSTRWWDYSDKFLNINGRICFTYSIFWGVMSIYLMRALNPQIDRFIDWIKSKIKCNILRIILIGTVAFMLIDCLYSASAEHWVLTKVSVEKKLDVENKEKNILEYNEVYNDEQKKAFVDKYWTVEKVLLAYPNLTKTTSDGKRIYVKKLYPEIHPYFLRIKPEKEGTIYEP